MGLTMRACNVCPHKCLWVLVVFAFCFCLNINPVRPVIFVFGTSDMHGKPNSKHISLANELQVYIFLRRIDKH